MIELEQAWAWREKNKLFSGTEAQRWFHGPSEGRGPTRALMIEVFANHAWVIEREMKEPLQPSIREQVAQFLKSKGVQSGVWLGRPEKGVPSEPSVFFGSPPKEGLAIKEDGALFEIRYQGTRHPGLFLDHRPLRKLLRSTVKDLRVLNTFCYTGSLSIACGLGQAAQVTSLDLSKPSIEWAKKNWQLNALPEDRAEWLVGDYFEMLPLMVKRERRFDCVILDPPSFSRGHKGTFSTQKDLVRLHELALKLIEPGGRLITSINSAQLTESFFEEQIQIALKQAKRRSSTLQKIEQPETFPVRADHPEDRYLKGFVLSIL